MSMCNGEMTKTSSCIAYHWLADTKTHVPWSKCRSSLQGWQSGLVCLCVVHEHMDDVFVLRLNTMFLIPWCCLLCNSEFNFVSSCETRATAQILVHVPQAFCWTGLAGLYRTLLTFHTSSNVLIVPNLNSDVCRHAYSYVHVIWVCPDRTYSRHGGTICARSDQHRHQGRIEVLTRLLNAMSLCTYHSPCKGCTWDGLAKIYTKRHSLLRARVIWTRTGIHFAATSFAQCHIIMHTFAHTAALV